GGVVQDLALEVGVIDRVEIDEADAADTRRGEVKPERRAEPAGADEQHARRLQALLPLDSDLRHDQVTRIALNFLRRQRGGLGAGAEQVKRKRHDARLERSDMRQCIECGAVLNVEAMRLARRSPKRTTVPGTLGKVISMYSPVQRVCFISTLVSAHGMNSLGWPMSNHGIEARYRPSVFAPTVMQPE